MKDPKPDKAGTPTDRVKGDVKPIRHEKPSERPKPTPNPPKKK